MADLDEEDVRHVARLARLALTEQEIASLRGELTDILGYAEQVGQVATVAVPPTGHALRLANVLRDDEPRPSLPPAEALSTAPEVERGRFRVPRIVEEEA
ncbi:MAG TPA: Asp-tRNA(Asn)/Glu-tRNA(Gln) amidotransferase subunit GatC [Egibacteraceae bacterium]|nr:Asp-tRNA(Asn)/Glu-tRNA(Gln) amidotransferase subunit GatC [Egibacteraceae bacterium]